MGKITLKEINNIYAKREAGAEEFFKFFSVLMPLVEVDGQLNMLFEVRGADLDRQPGEICFPGGALEAGETYEECAVRETCEELGIRAEDIKVISQLDTTYTYNNFAMTGFLGVIDYEIIKNIQVNEVEVADTFMVPVDFFIDNPPKVYINKFIPQVDEEFPTERITGSSYYNWRGGKAYVPVYEEYEGHIIWGLTARIIKRFIDVINGEAGKEVEVPAKAEMPAEAAAEMPAEAAVEMPAEAEAEIPKDAEMPAEAKEGVEREE